MTPSPIHSRPSHPRWTVPRAQHSATLLPNGTVLITGGTCEFPNTGVVPTCPGAALQPFQSIYFDSAEVYDPVANTFTSLSATMTSIRNAHTAALLPDGQVLVAGGINGSFAGSNPGTVLNTADLYDPTTEAFTALTGTMISRRAIFTATRLPNGKCS